MKDINNYCESQTGLFVIKDEHSIYLGTNQESAILVGWKSKEDAIGKTDFDLPCDACENAHRFIELDQKLLFTKKKLLTLDIQNYFYGWKILLGERVPFNFDDNKSKGILCRGIDVTDTTIFKSYFLLHQIDSGLFGEKIKPGSYILTNTYNPLNLTSKQENCLFLLVRGKSIKEIAKKFNLSPRTIECHIDAIKIKLNCQRKSELIEKAIASGFLGYIPTELQRCGFEGMP